MNNAKRLADIEDVDIIETYLNAEGNAQKAARVLSEKYNINITRQALNWRIKAIKGANMQLYYQLEDEAIKVYLSALQNEKLDMKVRLIAAKAICDATGFGFELKAKRAKEAGADIDKKVLEVLIHRNK